MDDNEIIGLYFARSEEAVAETQKKYGPYLRSVAFRITQNASDAEECENDTYLGAWNSIPPHRPQQLRTFLGRICRNSAVSRQRERMSEKRGGGEVPLVLDELAEILTDENETENGTDVGAQSASGRSGRIRDGIERFLLSSPKKTRMVFVQRYFYLCPVKEIAQEMEMTESAVKMTLSRAREALRGELKKEGIIL